MRLEFLGTRGEIKETSPRHRMHSALVIETRGKRILCDFGESWAEADLPKCDYIWLSHAHPDHVGGLKGRELRQPIFMSKATDGALSHEEFPFEDRRVVEGDFRFGTIRAREVFVHHSIKAPASGLVLSTEIGKVLYFPDVLSIPNRDQVMANAQIYIGDGASIARDLVRRKNARVYGHASMKTQIGWCEDASVPLTIFTHFGKEAVEMGDRALRTQLVKFAEKTRVQIAWDGREFEFTKSLREQEEIFAIAPPMLADLSNEEIEKLHDAIHQFWDAFLSGFVKANREEIVNRHLFLVVEMQKRKIPHEVIDDLDRETQALRASVNYDLERAQALFEAAENFVYVPDFVSVSGGFIYHAPEREPADIDIVLKAYHRDPNVELKLQREILKTTELEPHWVYEPRGPNWDHMPLYDLVLVKKQNFEIRKVEDSQEFKDKFYDIQSAVMPEARHALILVAPHPEMIVEGRKKMIVKSEPFKLDEPYYLVERDIVYGVIELEEPFEIDLADFERLRDEHQITEAERMAWWPDAEILYAYRIKRFVPFVERRRFKRKRGPQVIQRDIEFVESASPRGITAGKAFVPPKASKGYRAGEFREIDELYEFWARGYFEKNIPIAVEVKYDC